MEYIPVVTLEESVVKDILEKDEMYLIQSDMVTYASVFAQIKITGVIDKNLK